MAISIKLVAIFNDQIEYNNDYIFLWAIWRFSVEFGNEVSDIRQSTRGRGRDYLSLIEEEVPIFFIRGLRLMSPILIEFLDLENEIL